MIHQLVCHQPIQSDVRVIGKYSGKFRRGRKVFWYYKDDCIVFQLKINKFGVKYKDVDWIIYSWDYTTFDSIGWNDTVYIFFFIIHWHTLRFHAGMLASQAVIIIPSWGIIIGIQNYYRQIGITFILNKIFG